MRAALGAVAIAAAIYFVGASGAVAVPTEAMVSEGRTPAAKATVLAQRCRCTERRWNGSCKLRVCRDRW
jgi:hypothetical protein